MKDCPLCGKSIENNYKYCYSCHLAKNKKNQSLIEELNKKGIGKHRGVYYKTNGWKEYGEFFAGIIAVLGFLLSFFFAGSEIFWIIYLSLWAIVSIMIIIGFVIKEFNL